MCSKFGPGLWQTAIGSHRELWATPLAYKRSVQSLAAWFARPFFLDLASNPLQLLVYNSCRVPTESGAHPKARSYPSLPTHNNFGAIRHNWTHLSRQAWMLKVKRRNPVGIAFGRLSSLSRMTIPSPCPLFSGYRCAKANHLPLFYHPLATDFPEGTRQLLILVHCLRLHTRVFWHLSTWAHAIRAQSLIRLRRFQTWKN